jgi:pyridinium-3,5-bisthiocarboxylic acid mononucleotide nickel chelatase
MSSLHFDCFSGISGDMTLAALVDLGLPVKDLARALKALPLEGYSLESRKVRRGGVLATKVEVVIHQGLPSPVSISQIDRLIRSSRLPEPVKDRSRAVFHRLGEAESRAHGVKPAKVHFHEVGAVDSLVDVIGSVLACHLLALDQFTASPVNLGAGMIKSSHGILPVPGPAVAALAQGVPVFSAGPSRELTTPTGMALVRTLASEFGPMPLMQLDGVGCGAGKADFESWPNVLRVLQGAQVASMQGSTDRVVQIETNLDDLNPQAYETVIDRLFSLGALDVTLTPVIMKHGRPGVVLAVLAAREKADQVARAMLRETTTLGVRIQEVTRRVLPRRMESVRIGGHEVRIKVAALGPGEHKAAPEYQDCKRIAEQSGRPIREVMEAALVAFHKHRRRQP